MGFIIGCYTASPGLQKVQDSLEAMASFFVERGLRHRDSQLAPQCRIGWISKEGAAVPLIQINDKSFFGEVDLYNRQQLEAKLRRGGGFFGNVSDLELVASYIGEFGSAAISDINADFILGQLTGRTGHLRLFRDHMG